MTTFLAMGLVVVEVDYYAFYFNFICNEYLQPTARMPETILYAVLKELKRLVHISQSII